jgi:hypothetical protein
MPSPCLCAPQVLQAVASAQGIEILLHLPNMFEQLVLHLFRHTRHADTCACSRSSSGGGGGGGGSSSRDDSGAGVVEDSNSHNANNAATTAAGWSRSRAITTCAAGRIFATFACTVLRGPGGDKAAADAAMARFRSAFGAAGGDCSSLLSDLVVAGDVGALLELCL